MNNDINVMPVDDVREHTECAECACSPTVEIIGSSLLIIHNSFDGREFFEEIDEFLEGEKYVS